jgi:hypothetical protein
MAHMKHPHAHLERSVAAYLKVLDLEGTALRVEVLYEGVARLNVQHGPTLLLHRQAVARVRELHRLLWGNEAFRQHAGLERLKRAEAWLAPKPQEHAPLEQHGTFLVRVPGS